MRIINLQVSIQTECLQYDDADMIIQLYECLKNYDKAAKIEIENIKDRKLLPESKK